MSQIRTSILLLEIETALPEIETDLLKIEKPLPEIETATNQDRTL